VRILSLIHEDEAPSGTFGDVAREQGHELVEWNFRRGRPPAADDYDAYFVFGGAMHVDQEHEHPWLRDEDDLLRELLERGAPLFGVCLGGQLIAKAAGGRVGPAVESEVGWFAIELTPEGGDDPVLGRLPACFQAFQWHSYTFELPADAVPLAQNAAHLQAFRLGEKAWGVQFHPEVTQEILQSWLKFVDGKPERPNLDFAPLPHWNELGRRLCAAFLDAASARR
jgi:GMP synthase (glutamine-hydrolysing)